MKNSELEELVAPELDLLGFECVKLEIVGSSRNPIIRLYIDRPDGVSIRDCAMVSRTIGMLLDRSDPFPGRFLLEVSSPGNNRPLTKEEHYTRFVGEAAKVQIQNAELGKKTYTGHIRSCINGMLVLDEDGEQQLIRLSDVVRANLIAREYKIDKKRPKKDKGGRK